MPTSPWPKTLTPQLKLLGAHTSWNPSPSSISSSSPNCGSLLPCLFLVLPKYSVFDALPPKYGANGPFFNGKKVKKGVEKKGLDLGLPLSGYEKG